MAQILISLKWSYFLATFRGNVWAIVGMIFGGLYALGFVVMWASVSTSVGLQNPRPETIVSWLVGFGVVLSLLWWVVPLLTSGLDATLDPDRLALYPLSAWQIQIGQLVGGLIGLSGAVTLLATVATGMVLLNSPAYLMLYLLVSCLGLTLVMVVSRISSLLAIELNEIPGIRQALVILAFLILIGLGPIITLTTSALANFMDQLPALLEVLSWTPLGSAWGTAAHAYAGSWGVALAQLALTFAYATAGWYAWRKLLTRAMSRIGEMNGTASSKQIAAGNIGIFARFPATACGAIAARTVHTMIRDPRANLNLIIVPAFYLIFSLFGRVSIGEDGSVLSTGWFMLLFVPIMAGYVFCYLVSYDNSAFSMHVLSPVSGHDERWGRIWGMLLLVLPLVIIGASFMTVLSIGISALPGTLGLSVGLLLASTGVSAYADMMISIPTPPPGQNPFKTQRQSEGFAKGLVRAAVFFVNFVFALPGGILLVIYAVTGHEIFNWLGAGVSLVIGVLVLVFGAHLGAKKYDTSAADTLQRVSAFR